MFDKGCILHDKTMMFSVFGHFPSALLLKKGLETKLVAA
jgi:hypothetical protein